MKDTHLHIVEIVTMMIIGTKISIVMIGTIRKIESMKKIEGITITTNRTEIKIVEIEIIARIVIVTKKTEIEIESAVNMIVVIVEIQSIVIVIKKIETIQTLLVRQVLAVVVTQILCHLRLLLLL